MINLSTQQATSYTIEVLGELTAESEEILTPQALAFLQSLHDTFDGRRKDLLLKRQQRQARYRSVGKTGFLA